VTERARTLQTEREESWAHPAIGKRRLLKPATAFVTEKYAWNVWAGLTFRDTPSLPR
jgi:hypothetical protein